MNLANKLHGLLGRYLDKQGVADVTQLSEEEKATYEKWQEVLSAEVTLETVVKFLEDQLPKLDKDLREAVKQGEDRKAILITARIENYNDLKAVIAAPDRNREKLAAFITNLLKHE